MPVTIRGKAAQPTTPTKIDPGKGDPAPAASKPAGSEEVKSSRAARKSASGATTDGVKPDKGGARPTDSPQTTSTSRQRARERRRGRIADLSPEPSSPSPDPSTSAPSGRIKNLAGFWATQKEEAPVVSKKRLEIAERKADASDSDSDSDESGEVDGVKRAKDSAETAEVIEIEKGRAKSIANMWQSRKDEDGTAAKKKTPFRLDIKTEEPTVFENEPVVLEGVAKGDDRQARDELVVRRPGRIKDLASSFSNTAGRAKPEDSDEDDEDQDGAAEKDAKKEVVIERGKIQNVRERWKKRQQKSTGAKKDASDSASDGSDESSGTEVTPQRSSRLKSDQIIEQAKIRNLRERWMRRQGGSEDKDEVVQARPFAPAPLRALDTAKEFGVFENEPIVREDVVRADDEQTDIISVERTKKMRRMWTMMEKEGQKDRDARPAETTIRIKKKEEKQEAEPEPAKSPASKGQKSSRSQRGSAKSKEEEKPGEPESGKAGAKESKGEGRGKLQKAFTVAVDSTAATAAASKPSAPKSPSLMRYSSRKKNA